MVFGAIAMFTSWMLNVGTRMSVEATVLATVLLAWSPTINLLITSTPTNT